MANVCDKFRQNFKQTFIEQVASMFGTMSTDKWFLSIGKPLPWVSNQGEIDNLPPAAADTEQTEIEFWQNVLAHKKINQDDVAIVVPRYDWTIGTVYDPYRPNVDIFNRTNPYIFYVLVDEERVYKCIDNNYGAPSTIAPTHTDTDVKTLSDGYRWKYMYSITENSRRFLVKGSLKVGGLLRPGYMPVENIETLGINDERYLQFAVQNAAVDGEVVFIYFLPEYANYIISDRCVFFNPLNVLANDVAANGLTATISSPYISPIDGFYNDMILSIDDGQGSGQRRVISNYTAAGLSANYATVEVTNPFTVQLLKSTTKFSILPNVVLEGDGAAKNNSLDPLRTYADVLVRFNSATTEPFRYASGFEMIDTGKDFTFANLKVIKGLTFAPNTPASLITDFANIATPIISPKGGHGSNPVTELGANGFMIVKKYSGSEGGKITTQNEFRQFGIIKNPELASPQVRISTIQAGAAGSFTVGAKAYQDATGSYTGAYGTVVSWSAGTTGYTGTSELVLTNVVGNFTSTVQGSNIGQSPSAGSNVLSVFDVNTRTRAGTDGRDLLVLTITPTTATTFSTTNSQFPKGMNMVGLGNPDQNVPFTGSKGKIYRWLPTAGLSNQGKLFLESYHGEFYVNENVGTRDRYMNLYPFGGITGIGKIVEKAEAVEQIPAVYNQVHKFTMSPAAGDAFTTASFVLDSIVNGYSGSSMVATGRVINWNTSGATGDLSLLVTSGNPVAGNLIPYTNSAGNELDSLITTVNLTPDLKYRSGQVQYIQNMRPIVRSDNQEEEIKLVIEI